MALLCGSTSVFLRAIYTQRTQTMTRGGCVRLRCVRCGWRCVQSVCYASNKHAFAYIKRDAGNRPLAIVVLHPKGGQIKIILVLVLVAFKKRNRALFSSQLCIVSQPKQDVDTQSGKKKKVCCSNFTRFSKSQKLVWYAKRTVRGRCW